MSRALHQKDGGMGPLLVFSAICHLAIYVLLAKFHLTGLNTAKEEPVYYVDVVNLPVAHPQAGSPTAAGPPSPPLLQPNLHPKR